MGVGAVNLWFWTEDQTYSVLLSLRLAVCMSNNKITGESGCIEVNANICMCLGIARNID